MAKYNDVFPDTKEIFDEVIVGANLDNFVNILVLADNKQKDIGKVVKANPILKYKTDDDVVVIINESIFELLDDSLKLITAEMIMAGISYNSEKDKIEINKPDFTIHTGLLKKYGGDVCINLHEVIRAAFAQKAEQDAEEEVA
jgi:hypothetical protein